MGQLLSKVTKNLNLHFTSRIAFRNEFCRVSESRLETLLYEVIMDRLDCVFIHL
jgi:hypothetical protein